MYVAGGYNQNYNNQSGAPFTPVGGMGPMYPQGYPQGYPQQQPMVMGYSQPVIITQPTAPNTVIVKQKVKDDSGVAEGCCAGFCVGCLALLCCCCMAGGGRRF